MATPSERRPLKLLDYVNDAVLLGAHHKQSFWNTTRVITWCAHNITENDDPNSGTRTG
jgi:hypothetical protein